MQKLETSLLKSMIPIVKMSYKLLELKFNSKSASESDSLALMGHSINEVNIKRRKLIKPDLNDQLKQLCGSHTTVTKQLFGYDLPKSVRKYLKPIKWASRFRQNHRLITTNSRKDQTFLIAHTIRVKSLFYGDIKGQGRDHTWTSKRYANQINTNFCQTSNHLHHL